MKSSRFIAVGIGIMVASHACAATIYTVDCTGAGDFTTIQAAINAAATGDTIIIRPNTCNPQGHYLEQLNISSKSLALRSLDPADPAVVAATIIDGGTGANTVKMSYQPSSAPVRLSGLTIVNGGVGVFLDSASAEIDRVNISGCANEGLNATSFGSSLRTLTLSQCEINHTKGVGVYNYGLVIRDSVFSDSLLSTLRASYGTIDIRNSIFLRGGLGGVTFGGGLDVGDASSMRVVNCIISDSRAWRGAGLSMRSYHGSTDHHLVRNCLIYGNVATGEGGGVKLWGDGITFDHCTVVGNRSAGSGPGIFCYDGVSRLTNSIAWNNRRNTALVSPDLAGIYQNITTFNDFQYGLASVNGNFSADPGFLNPGVWDDHGTPDDFSDDTYTPGDFRLSPGSPCINTGDPAYLGPLDEVDLAGRPRSIGCRTDLGAYEANQVGPGAGDLSGDGMVTQEDLPFFIQAQLNVDTLDCRADCNGDGLMNGQDIAAFLALIH